MDKKFNVTESFYKKINIKIISNSSYELLIWLLTKIHIDL